MSQSMREKAVVHRIVAVLVLAVMFAVSMLSMTAAYAVDDDGKSTLANHSYVPGDLYSSIIYSQSDDVQSADGVELSYATIAKYPSAKDTEQRYGLLDRPSGEDPNSNVGGELVSRMRTMYDYGWFEPSPKESDNFLSMVAQTVIHGLSDGVTQKATRGALNGAIVGATIFDAGAGLFKVMQEGVSHLNIPSLLGLVPGGTDGQGDGWLSNVLRSLLSRVGVNNANLKVIQYIFLAGVAFVCIVITIFTLTGDRAKSKHLNNTRRWYSRFLVMIMTIPLGVLATGAVSGIATAGQSTLDKMPQEFNQSYIVNTLDWAVYTNLDLAAINPTGSLNTDGSASTDYEPTQARVQNLQRAISSAKSGYLVKNNASADDTSARAMLENFAAGKTATVKDYYDGIASIPCSPKMPATGGWQKTNQGKAGIWVCNRQAGGPAMAANSSVFSNFDAGWTNDHEFRTEKATTPFFLSESTAEETKAASSEDSSDSDSKSDAKDDSDRNNTTERDFADVKFKVPNDGKMKVRPIDLNSPQSYIYGAIPPENLSESTKSFANYIYNPLGQGFVENTNPETGEKIDDGCKEDNCRAIRTNALSLAIYNRYAGLSSTKMSDQSTSFMLQTKRSGSESVNYKGFYTAANSAGESKNTGMYGNSFIQYVMPTTSPADYYGRMGSLTAIWMIAGIITFAVLFILMRTPIFAAVFKSFKGFLVALFTGNLVELVRYLAYYTAFMASFMTAGAAIYLGVAIGKNFIADSTLVQAMLGMTSAQGSVSTLVVGWIPVVGDAVKASSGLAFLVPLMLVAVLFTGVLCWPFMRMTTFSGQYRRTSILGAIVNIPYLVAQALDDKVTEYGRYLYGQGSGGSSRVMWATRKNKAAANNTNRQIKREQKQVRQDARSDGQQKAVQVGKAGLKLATVGLAAGGLAVATGGLGAGVGTSMMGKAMGGFGRTKAGQMVANVAGQAMRGAGRNDLERRDLGENTLGNKVSNVAAKAFNGAESVLKHVPGGAALIGADGLFLRAVNALIDHDLRGRLDTISSVYTGDRANVGESADGAPGDGSAREDENEYGAPRTTEEGARFANGAGEAAAGVLAGQATTDAESPNVGAEGAEDQDRSGAQFVPDVSDGEPLDAKVQMVDGQWVNVADGSIIAPDGEVSLDDDDLAGANLPHLVGESGEDITGKNTSEIGAPLAVNSLGEIDLPNVSGEDLMNAGVTIDGANIDGADVDMSDVNLTANGIDAGDTAVAGTAAGLAAGAVGGAAESSVGSVHADSVVTPNADLSAGSVSVNGSTNAVDAPVTPSVPNPAEFARTLRENGSVGSTSVASTDQPIQAPSVNSAGAPSVSVPASGADTSAATAAVASAAVAGSTASMRSLLEETMRSARADRTPSAPQTVRAEMSGPVRAEINDPVRAVVNGSTAAPTADDIGRTVGDRMDDALRQQTSALNTESVNRMDDQARESLRVARNASPVDSGLFNDRAVPTYQTGVAGSGSSSVGGVTNVVNNVTNVSGGAPSSDTTAPTAARRASADISGNDADSIIRDTEATRARLQDLLRRGRSQ